MRWVLLAAVFGVASAAFARPAIDGGAWDTPEISQPPVPGNREHADEKPPDATNYQNEKSADQRGTEAAPIIVKVVNAPERAEKPEKANTDALPKPAPDWGSPEWSIVWATLVLVVVGGLQLAMFFRQLRYMRVGMNDAKIAAEAARDAANAANLSAKAAIALELPLLRVSPSIPVPLKDDATILFIPSARIEGTPITQITKYAVIDDLIVHNVGRTSATPLGIKLGTMVAHELEGEPMYTNDHGAEAQSLLPGDKSVQAPIAVIITLTAGEMQQLQKPGEFFWIYVEIAYLDFMDQKHEVRFCWRWERHISGGWRWAPQSAVPAAY